MKFPIKKIVNLDSIKSGLVELNFLPLSVQKSNTGLEITVEVASTNTGSIVHFVTATEEQEIVSSNFQFIPGVVPLIKENKQIVLYDEISGNLSLSELVNNGDVVDVDTSELISDEDLEKAEAQHRMEESDKNIDRMFEGVDEEADEEESLLKPEEPTDEQAYEEEEDEEEETRSLQEIQALVNKKKRGNIDYIGVDAPSPLPSENGPRVNIEEEEEEKEETPEPPKKPAPKQEDKKESNNQMQRRERPNKRDKYEKRKEFHSKQERQSKKEFKNRKSRLSMEDYDDISSMFK